MLNTNKLHVIEDQQGLSIQFAWFSPTAIFLAFFCLVWFGFLTFWYTMAGATGAPLLFFIFPLIHVAVGLGLGYYTLCLFFNKTYIDIHDHHLWVHHTPIPWWKGNVNIAVQDIEQVYVKEKKQKNKNGSSYTYEVLAKMKGGLPRKLLDIGLSNSEQALALEELIENHLGITDSPVKGAYGSVRAPAAPPPASLPTTNRKPREELELPPPEQLDLHEARKEILPEWDEEDLV